MTTTKSKGVPYQVFKYDLGMLNYFDVSQPIFIIYTYLFCIWVYSNILYKQLYCNEWYLNVRPNYPNQTWVIEKIEF